MALSTSQVTENIGTLVALQCENPAERTRAVRCMYNGKNQGIVTYKKIRLFHFFANLIRYSSARLHNVVTVKM